MYSIIAAATLNICFTVYFARKKWFFASLTYALSSLVLLSLAFLTAENRFVADGLIGMIGVNAYNACHSQLLLLIKGALSPYLAINLLGIVCFIVLAAKTAERIIRRVCAKSSTVYDRSGRAKPERLRLPRFVLFEKKYLSYCVMLC